MEKKVLKFSVLSYFIVRFFFLNYYSFYIISLIIPLHCVFNTIVYSLAPTHCGLFWHGVELTEVWEIKQRAAKDNYYYFNAEIEILFLSLAFMLHSMTQQRLGCCEFIRSFDGFGVKTELTTMPIVPSRGPEFISRARSVWVGTHSAERHFVFIVCGDQLSPPCFHWFIFFVFCPQGFHSYTAATI